MIYAWIEHEFLWAVRIRPAELFEQATVDGFPSWEEWDDPDVDGEPEGSLGATNVLTGERCRYIKIYDKRWFSRRQVEALHDGEDEWDRRHAHQLAQLPPERWLEFHQPEQTGGAASSTKLEDVDTPAEDLAYFAALKAIPHPKGTLEWFAAFREAKADYYKALSKDAVYLTETMHDP